MSELTVWASTCLESSTPALNVQMAPRLETMKFLWLCLCKPPFSSIILSHNAHILSKFKCMLWNQRFWIFLLLPLESTFSLFSIYMTLIIWIANSSPYWFSTYSNILKQYYCLQFFADKFFHENLRNDLENNVDLNVTHCDPNSISSNCFTLILPLPVSTAQLF